MSKVDQRALETGEATLVVRESDLASALDSDETEFPAVFATSRMVALMEVAAARCLLPLLEPGELSVGVEVDVHHTAASAVGARIRARARWLRLEGKLHHFEVFAEDEGGDVGYGRHTRAIVKSARLVERASTRLAPAL